MTLIVINYPAPPVPRPRPRLCGSSTAARASLEGAVHLDRRPISQASIDQRVRWFDFLV